ncbi:hypothetical protein [Cryobacterium sp. PH31-O1]|uniref:hypothetical protein n=1 Tax=Cryobacterium sp. PH31-O1 TaxID=3046306 RepID=UPI0024B8D762|nr:hypothetical protein [Cryobacterium sp. PH31-O1]MDJ0337313.1 hypothetical protein [Cryobacterium sp. PH31-O1]
MFGEGHDPDPSQIAAGLGSRWRTMRYGIKPYASMGGLHAAIDDVLALETHTPIDVTSIREIRVDVSDAVFHHGGFDIQRPLIPITAQMSLKYTVPVVLLDGAALIDQYEPDRINRDDVWDLIEKATVTHDPDFDGSTYKTRVRITMEDGSCREKIVDKPTGSLGNPLSDDEIVAKYRMLTEHIIDHDRRQAIQDAVLGLEQNENGPRDLMALLAPTVGSALAFPTDVVNAVEG